MNNSGIYFIFNIVSKKYYIGSSKNLNKRVKEHFSKLKRNIHINSYLQNAFNKYGEESFIVIYDFYDENIRYEIEQIYLNSVNWSETYNINRKASGNYLPGKLNGFYGKKHSSTAKKIMSLTHQNKIISEEHKESISTFMKNRKGKKHHRHIKVKIDDVLYYGLREAERMLNISRKIITRRLKSDKFPNYQYA